MSTTQSTRRSGSAPRARDRHADARAEALLGTEEFIFHMAVPEEVADDPVIAAAYRRVWTRALWAIRDLPERS